MLFTNWNVNAKRNKVPNAPICWNSEQLGNKISLDRHGKFLRKRKFYIFWTWHALTQVSLILGLTQNLIWSRAAEFYLEFPEKWEEISVAIEKLQKSWLSSFARPAFLTYVPRSAAFIHICFTTSIFQLQDISGIDFWGKQFFSSNGNQRVFLG